MFMHYVGHPWMKILWFRVLSLKIFSYPMILLSLLNRRDFICLLKNFPQNWILGQPVETRPHSFLFSFPLIHLIGWFIAVLQQTHLLHCLRVIYMQAIQTILIHLPIASYKSNLLSTFQLSLKSIFFDHQDNSTNENCNQCIPLHRTSYPTLPR